MCLLTDLCFLLLLLRRLFFLAPFFLLGNPLFHCGVHLASSCSCSDPLLAKVRLLLTLTFSPLMTWYSGLTALFPFLSAKVALAYLPTALSVAPRPLFPFQQAQYVQIFLLKPVPFCTLFAGFGSMNKSAISFLLSGSRSVLATLCVFPFT